VEGRGDEFNVARGGSDAGVRTAWMPRGTERQRRRRRTGDGGGARGSDVWRGDARVVACERGAIGREGVRVVDKIGLHG
jgi:hypothetical protein